MGLNRLSDRMARTSNAEDGGDKLLFTSKKEYRNIYKDERKNKGNMQIDWVCLDEALRRINQMHSLKFQVKYVAKIIYD